MKGLLWQPGRLGPVELRNRTIRSATNEHLSQPDGQLTQVWAETLAELARNEVGLVITGHLCVDRTQRADEGQPVLDGQTDRALLAQAAEEVHRAGGRIAAQLDFSPEELDRLVEQFRLGVQLCREAGFDAVQIHTAHGYLLSNFLNPAENLRTDQYGGGLENRFRLVGRILQAAREACGPEMALLVKADCNGCGDLHRLLELYQEADVDGVELSGVDFAARAGEKSPFYLQEALRAGGPSGHGWNPDSPQPGGRHLRSGDGGGGAGTGLHLCLLQPRPHLPAGFYRPHEARGTDQERLSGLQRVLSDLPPPPGALRPAQGLHPSAGEGVRVLHVTGTGPSAGAGFDSGRRPKNYACKISGLSL